MAIFNLLESKQSLADQSALETKVVELAKLQDQILKLYDSVPKNKKIVVNDNVKKINELMNKVNKKMEARRHSLAHKQIDAVLADCNKLDATVEAVGNFVSVMKSVRELSEMNKYR